MSAPRVAICAIPPYSVTLQAEAAELAASLGIPKTRIGQPNCDILLAVTGNQLQLRIVGEDERVGGRPVYADLASIDVYSPAGRKLDVPLLKAVGIKKGNPHRPRVVDCTAGLGEDAWLLAAQECNVRAIERHPVIAELLKDALAHGEYEDANIAGRITVVCTDSIEWLEQHKLSLKDQADAIVIDPMFPQGRKTLERKPMRVLRMLAGNDDDAPKLLSAAIDTGVHRICVKRPRKAPAIEHNDRPKPDVVYTGKAVRFDVYINA